LNTTGAVSTGPLTVSGALSAGSLNTTGAVSTGPLTVSGALLTSTLNATGAVATGTLTVTGNITASGNISATGTIAAKYQDVAEWVPASRAISAGTVVVLDVEQSNHVLPSNRSYDTRVAGVVSANPGVILGEAGAGKVMVATTGRVKIKVDATAGPIRVGDLLVTSDKEGIAMKSQPLDLGGTPIHRPGTLIGKALEPLEKGVGEILALLSLQ
ncbi:MAG: peptidase G2 autoproteolytic cleavage domain-containing protein, partial [Acidobacteriota bacterium]